jgi:hypothetical protein
MAVRAVLGFYGSMPRDLDDLAGYAQVLAYQNCSNRRRSSAQHIKLIGSQAKVQYEVQLINDFSRRRQQSSLPIQKVKAVKLTSVRLSFLYSQVFIFLLLIP